MVRSLSNKLKSKQPENIGDLGLCLWLLSKNEESVSDAVFKAINDRGKPYETPTRTVYATMELSWLLSGLLQYHEIVKSRRTTKKSEEVKDILVQHCFNKETCLFYETHENRRFSTFNNQIYPIYSLARYYKLFGDQEALSCAIRCCQKICSLQGPRGQWWWAYDIRRGTVADRYPVYSVHQDGMSPMALLYLSEVSGENFQYYAFKGLNWLLGENELGVSIVDWDKNIIWRSIRRKKPFRIVSSILVNANLGGFADFLSRYEIDYESRPYHYGWLLYALSRWGKCDYSQ